MVPFGRNAKSLDRYTIIGTIEDKSAQQFLLLQTMFYLYDYVWEVIHENVLWWHLIFNTMESPNDVKRCYYSN